MGLGSGRLLIRNTAASLLSSCAPCVLAQRLRVPPDGIMSPEAFSATNVIYGAPHELTDNGGWCWFENERATIAGNHLFASTIGSAGGLGGPTRVGHVEVNSLDLSTGTAGRHVMGEGTYFEGDDHNTAALWMRPDRRLVAMYTRHGADPIIRYAISNAGAYGEGDWSEEKEIDTSAYTAGENATYSNLYYLKDVGTDGASDTTPGRLYDFYRSGTSRHYLISDDWGETWRQGGVLMYSSTQDPERRFENPYHQFKSNGRDEIHYIFNDAHPRVPATHNRVYHVSVKDGYVRRSDGTRFQRLSDVTGGVPNDPIAYSEVAGTISEVWNSEAHEFDDAWVSDLEIDENGNPYVAFSAQKDGFSDNGEVLPVRHG